MRSRTPVCKCHNRDTEIIWPFFKYWRYENEVGYFSFEWIILEMLPLNNPLCASCPVHSVMLINIHKSSLSTSLFLLSPSPPSPPPGSFICDDSWNCCRTESTSIRKSALIDIWSPPFRRLWPCSSASWASGNPAQDQRASIINQMTNFVTDREVNASPSWLIEEGADG